MQYLSARRALAMQMQINTYLTGYPLPYLTGYPHPYPVRYLRRYGMGTYVGRVWVPT